MDLSTNHPQDPLPSFFYGTAWKEERTQELVELAIQSGFRAIDTANQRKHYFEAAVGKAILASIQRGDVQRSELFVQSKYTFVRGQDHRLPYDPHRPIAIQVQQSFQSSLDHLQTDYLDSLLLHGPSSSGRLAAPDFEAWSAIEELQASGKVRRIGVSNFAVEQLDELLEKAKVVPSFVQNRCYAALGWDRAMREKCAQHEIRYQGFSLLTANRALQGHAGLIEIAKRYQATVSQIIFRFAQQRKMIPLTGTSKADHMRLDLSASNFDLTEEELNQIESAGL